MPIQYSLVQNGALADDSTPQRVRRDIQWSVHIETCVTDENAFALTQAKPLNE